MRGYRKKAGITEELDACARLLEPDYFEDQLLPPLFTKARAEARERQGKSKFSVYRQCMRRAVFGITDKDVRKDVITAERGFHTARLESFQDDFGDAQIRLSKIGRMVELYLPLAGVFFVIVGWEFGGPMGGTAGAVFSLIVAPLHLQEIERAKRRASEEVSRLEATVNEIVDEEVFSRQEEDTGEDQEEWEGRHKV